MWWISKYYNKILYIYSLSHFIFYVDFILLYILECMNFLEFHDNVFFFVIALFKNIYIFNMFWNVYTLDSMNKIYKNSL
jgi:hypothetical protein